MSTNNQNQTPTDARSQNQQTAVTAPQDSNVQTSDQSAETGKPNGQVPQPGALRSFFSLELFFDFLLIMVTGIYAYFAFNQWKAIDKQADIMNAQLTLIRDSSAQTERLILANESLAAQNRALVEHAREQTKASLTQAEAAQNAASAAAEGARIARESSISEIDLTSPLTPFWTNLR